jgi:BirA family biotin operon repressor/biotin-[acetyl-CoA-carboxylase] ligase
VLVEQREARGASFVIIGHGLNLDWRDAPAEEPSWVSVAEVTGTDVDRWEVLADLLVALDQRLDEVEHDPAELLERYRQHSATLGRHVEVERAGDRIAGVADAVDADGALVVNVGGERVAVTAGDVVHVSVTAWPLAQCHELAT